MRRRRLLDEREKGNPGASAEQFSGKYRGQRILFATVSGVVTTNPGMIRRVDDDVPEIGLITTKSFQVKPNLGNREPVVAEIEEGSFGNAVGLRNPGMTEGLKGLEK